MALPSLPIIGQPSHPDDWLDDYWGRYPFGPSAGGLAAILAWAASPGLANIARPSSGPGYGGGTYTAGLKLAASDTTNARATKTGGVWEINSDLVIFGGVDIAAGLKVRGRRLVIANRALDPNYTPPTNRGFTRKTIAEYLQMAPASIDRPPFHLLEGRDGFSLGDGVQLDFQDIVFLGMAGDINQYVASGATNAAYQVRITGTVPTGATLSFSIRHQKVGGGNETVTTDGAGGRSGPITAPFTADKINTALHSLEDSFTDPKGQNANPAIRGNPKVFAFSVGDTTVATSQVDVDHNDQITFDDSGTPASYPVTCTKGGVTAGWTVAVTDVPSNMVNRKTLSMNGVVSLARTATWVNGETDALAASGYPAGLHRWYSKWRTSDCIGWGQVVSTDSGPASMTFWHYTDWGLHPDRMITSGGGHDDVHQLGQQATDMLKTKLALHRMCAWTMSNSGLFLQTPTGLQDWIIVQDFLMRFRGPSAKPMDLSGSNVRRSGFVNGVVDQFWRDPATEAWGGTSIGGANDARASGGDYCSLDGMAGSGTFVMDDYFRWNDATSTGVELTGPAAQASRRRELAHGDLAGFASPTVPPDDSGTDPGGSTAITPGTPFTGTATASNTTLGITAPAGGVAAGQRLAILVAANGDPTTVTATATDASGNTYAQDDSFKWLQATGGFWVLSGPVTTAIAAGATITVTFSAAVSRKVGIAIPITGLASSPFDTPLKVHGAGGTTASLSVGPGTPSQADDIVFAVFGLGVGASTSAIGLTPGSGWTLDGDVNSASGSGANRVLAVAHALPVSTAAITATATIGTANAWDAILVGYKAAVAAPVSKSGSDTATGTDSTGELAVAAAATDASTASDASAVVQPTAASDTASSTAEAGASVASTDRSDTAAATDVSALTRDQALSDAAAQGVVEGPTSLDATATRSDTAAPTLEAGAVANPAAVSDSATSTAETASTSVSVPSQDIETVAATDARALQVTATRADAAALAGETAAVAGDVTPAAVDDAATVEEARSVATLLDRTDSPAATDTAATTSFLPAADASGPAVETSSSSVATTRSDAATTVETSGVSVQTVLASGSDALAGITGESASIQIVTAIDASDSFPATDFVMAVERAQQITATTDTGTATDTSAPVTVPVTEAAAITDAARLGLARADTAAALEATTVSQALTDTAAAADASTVGLNPSDAGDITDTAAPSLQATRADAGTGAEGAPVTGIATGRGDNATTVETAQPIAATQLITGADTAAAVDAALPAAALATSDGGQLTDRHQALDQATADTAVAADVATGVGRPAGADAATAVEDELVDVAGTDAAAGADGVSDLDVTRFIATRGYGESRAESETIAYGEEP